MIWVIQHESNSYRKASITILFKENGQSVSLCSSAYIHRGKNSNTSGRVSVCVNSLVSNKVLEGSRTLHCFCQTQIYVGNDHHSYNKPMLSFIYTHSLPGFCCWKFKVSSMRSKGKREIENTLLAFGIWTYTPSSLEQYRLRGRYLERRQSSVCLSYRKGMTQL